MKPVLVFSLVALALSLPASAQDEQSKTVLPSDVIAAAPASDWVAIPPEDLLVMTLTPDRDGNAREVVIQLMPPPFSQGWVENIRTLARAQWYDGIAVVRVQDNYVVQWGDPNHDNPEASGPAKPLPEGLNAMGEDAYAVRDQLTSQDAGSVTLWHPKKQLADSYADWAWFEDGWPVASVVSDDGTTLVRSPAHCYGMVGVGRGFSPDTGSGAELYAVIGHAPRHLDRNIAVVGRVIEGMEHLSSLPRGTGALGFYETAEQRTPIVSIRMASDLPVGERQSFEYLSTEGASFAAYVDARANRGDAFYIHPAGGVDVCNVPVPIRRIAD